MVQRALMAVVAAAVMVILSQCRARAARVDPILLLMPRTARAVVAAVLGLGRLTVWVVREASMVAVAAALPAERISPARKVF